MEEVNQVGYLSNTINQCMATLPKIAMDVQDYLSCFDHKAAQKDDKYNFFVNTEEYESIEDHKLVLRTSMIFKLNFG